MFESPGCCRQGVWRRGSQTGAGSHKSWALPTELGDGQLGVELKNLHFYSFLRWRCCGWFGNPTLRTIVQKKREAGSPEADISVLLEARADRGRGGSLQESGHSSTAPSFVQGAPGVWARP